MVDSCSVLVEIGLKTTYFFILLIRFIDSNIVVVYSFGNHYCRVNFPHIEFL